MNVPPEEALRPLVQLLEHTDLQLAHAIAAKRSLVGLLNEATASTMWLALTRPDRHQPLVQHPWMGPVPNDWKVVRLKTLLGEFDNRSTSGQETLLSLRMYEGLVPAADFSKRPVVTSRLVGYKIVHDGALVMNRSAPRSGSSA